MTDASIYLHPFVRKGLHGVVLVYDSANHSTPASAFYNFVLYFLEKTNAAPAGNDSGDENSNGLIPLFLSPDPPSYRIHGFSIPREFVLAVNEMETLTSRIRQLRLMYKEGLSKEMLRCMGVGAFRKALCMDDDNHGRGIMDPHDLASHLTLSEAKLKWVIKGKKDQVEIFWPSFVLAKIDAIKNIVQNGTPSADNLKTADMSKEACVAHNFLFGAEMDAIKKTMNVIVNHTQAVPRSPTAEPAAS